MNEKRREIELLILTMVAAAPLYATQTVPLVPLLVFHVLLLVPSAHALIAVHMKREQRMHREVVEAIRQHGPPPGYPR